MLQMLVVILVVSSAGAAGLPMVHPRSRTMCDEAVIALLACTPAAYAQQLLDLVALKQELIPCQFPRRSTGGRDTRAIGENYAIATRMSAKTPWWCWLVLALAAAATLPGATLVIGPRDQVSKDFLAWPGADFVNSKRIAMHHFEADDASGHSPFSMDYAVADLVEKLISPAGETPAAAREHLPPSFNPPPLDLDNDEPLESEPGTLVSWSKSRTDTQLGTDLTKRSLGRPTTSLLSVKRSEVTTHRAAIWHLCVCHGFRS